jgi:hypothetical protein
MSKIKITGNAHRNMNHSSLESSRIDESNGSKIMSLQALYGAELCKTSKNWHFSFYVTVLF